MKIAPGEWQALSALLDEALDMPGEAREPWLQGLDPGYAALRPALRELLSRAASLETADFLGDRAVLAAPEPPVRADQVVGPYRLIRELGQGGMGSVWLAERTDGLLKRQVALKLPHAGIRGRELTERFDREREILAALAHPNIARLYDAGIAADGQPYLALEYVEGSAITLHCDGGRRTIPERLGLFQQVLGAVQYAHAHLVIHRDIKPSNILVDASGRVLLLDFGIAKLMADGHDAPSSLTQLGGRALTPDYASPEQILGAPITTASDIYSLGVVLYELLAGARPYALRRESRGALEDAILSVDPPRPSHTLTVAAADGRGTTTARLARLLRGDLDTIALKALRKRPTERYASVDAFMLDLLRYARGEPVAARPDSALYRLGKFVARNKLGIAAAAVASLSLAAGTGMSLWQARAARAQAAAAKREAEKATAVQEFLVEVFGANSHLQADPARARNATARELLDNGARLIGRSLRDDPQAKEAVLATLSDMYEQMGLDDEAGKLSLQRIGVLRLAYGENDPRVAEGIFQYTRNIANSGERARILPALAQAGAILDANHDAISPARAALWLEYAHFYRYTAPARMRAYADRAVGLLARAHAREWIYVLALKEAARGRFELGEPAAAKREFQLTLDTIHALQPGASAWEVAPLAQLAGAEAELLEIEPAERHFRAAWELSRRLNGDAHSETVQSQVRLGSLLHLTSREAEGRELMSAALAAVEIDPAKQGNSVAPVVYGLYGQALARDGKLGAARELLDRELRFVRNLYPESTLLSKALLHQADLGTLEGRLAEAESRLDEAAKVWTDVSGGMDPAAFNPFLLARARLEIARGAPDVALAALDRLEESRESGRLPPLDRIGAAAARERALAQRQAAAAGLGPGATEAHNAPARDR